MPPRDSSAFGLFLNEPQFYPAKNGPAARVPKRVGIWLEPDYSGGFLVEEIHEKSMLLAAQKGDQSTFYDWRIFSY
jgi:hypothetical protein